MIKGDREWTAFVSGCKDEDHPVRLSNNTLRFWHDGVQPEPACIFAIQLDPDFAALNMLRTHLDGKFSGAVMLFDPVYLDFQRPVGRPHLLRR